MRQCELQEQLDAARIELQGAKIEIAELREELDQVSTIFTTTTFCIATVALCCV